MAIDLQEFKKDYHSQHGEDGIIQQILVQSGISDGYFVEFGAWDGVFLSNMCHLAEQGWEGVFIEADRDRYEDLKRNHAPPKLELINSLVTPSGEHSLENILKKTRFAGRSPAVLSIDIDSDDLAVWEGMTELRPLLVIIEYNSTIPADVSFRNPAGRQFGNSSLAIYEHAASIGYALVAQTETNMLFMPLGAIPETIKPLDFLQTQRTAGDRFFFGYDGTLIRSAQGREMRTDEVFPVPWTNAPFLQPIPASFRRRYRSSLPAYFLMISLKCLEILLIRPLPVIQFVIRNHSKVVPYLRCALGRASSAEKLAK